MKKLIIVFVVLFLVGCTQQPQKMGNTTYPQIELSSTDISHMKNKLVGELTKSDFSLMESSDFKMDFRKQFKDGEDAFARGMMQAADNSNISAKGIEFTFYTIGNITTVKAKPYLYKTFPFNRQMPEKFDMSNNNSYYNNAQNVLNALN